MTIPMTQGGSNDVACLRGPTALPKLCAFSPEGNGCSEDVWSSQLARALRQEFVEFFSSALRKVLPFAQYII